VAADSRHFRALSCFSVHLISLVVCLAQLCIPVQSTQCSMHTVSAAQLTVARQTRTDSYAVAITGMSFLITLVPFMYLHCSADILYQTGTNCSVILGPKSTERNAPHQLCCLLSDLINVTHLWQKRDSDTGGESVRPSARQPAE
jgi:hypothetical protein